MTQLCLTQAWTKVPLTSSPRRVPTILDLTRQLLGVVNAVTAPTLGKDRKLNLSTKCGKLALNDLKGPRLH